MTTSATAASEIPRTDSTVIARTVATARRAFDSGRTQPLSWRRAQLRALMRMLSESADEIHVAVAADLGKAPVEAHLSEVGAIVAEAKSAIRNLRRWTRDRPVGGSLTRIGPSRATIHREPLGTVLIIGPWNYPLHLLFMPFIGAVAAGNSVVLKPSELAPHCSELVARLVPQYLDPEAFQVVEGGVAETTDLLAERFDHIFYTGNGAVGSLVMQAAAKTLTPVTLELGGKSPVWVDSTVDIDAAAASIAWGKFSNAGQTCVAPDYVLTTVDVAPKLAAAIAARITAMYGTDPRTSPDFGRIINSRHTERLAKLIDSGTVVAGGQVDISQRYVEPTVLTDVSLDSPAMQQEIFGPILPIVTVAGLDEAIAVIRSNDKPLALYAFTTSREAREKITARTSSGGLMFGGVMVHLGVPTLPFGGVGGSGMGAYHGEHSLQTFSHERAILRKLPGPDLTRFAYPPFTAKKAKMLIGS
ncbi:aldehyde dehydrogenase family protein [Arthrobacter sp. NPDC056493]|uniref:aldehyde dehydrogenase family protein n=1 Tax=Arthrobacter sp. NPDC056493 TaxID=3345839 RepID=UPI003672CD72